MPEKYQIVFKRDSSQLFTAQEKAPKDIVDILNKYEYKLLFINIKESLYPFFRVPYLMLKLFFCFSKLKSNSEVFFQYPFTNYVNYFFWLFQLKKINLKVLVHDLVSLRYQGKISGQEIICLSKFNEVIVHTDSMKSLLLQKGINAFVLKTLNLFDYLIELKEKVSSQKIGYKICFAGNLDKSLFLNKLKSVLIGNISFVLYGSEPLPNDILNEKVIYGGRFSPDDPSILNGNWGLVWDGDSIETCDGQLGNYLKFNSSHKLSLYLAKEIPVIVWSQSAVAKYISDNHLGLIIDSLQDIETKVENLGEEAYVQIMKHVNIFSEKIRNGEMLGTLIK